LAGGMTGMGKPLLPRATNSSPLPGDEEFKGVTRNSKGSGVFEGPAALSRQANGGQCLLGEWLVDSIHHFGRWPCRGATVIPDGDGKGISTRGATLNCDGDKKERRLARRRVAPTSFVRSGGVGLGSLKIWRPGSTQALAAAGISVHQRGLAVCLNFELVRSAVRSRLGDWARFPAVATPPSVEPAGIPEAE
jgi:hypothetical protein